MRSARLQCVKEEEERRHNDRSFSPKIEYLHQLIALAIKVNLTGSTVVVTLPSESDIAAVFGGPNDSVVSPKSEPAVLAGKLCLFLSIPLFFFVE